MCRDLFTNLDKDKSNSISSEEMVDGLRSQVSWFCCSWGLHARWQPWAQGLTQ